MTNIFETSKSKEQLLWTPGSQYGTVDGSDRLLLKASIESNTTSLIHNPPVWDSTNIISSFVSKLEQELNCSAKLHYCLGGGAYKSYYTNSSIRDLDYFLFADDKQLDQVVERQFCTAVYKACQGYQHKHGEFPVKIFAPAMAKSQIADAMKIVDIIQFPWPPNITTQTEISLIIYRYEFLNKNIFTEEFGFPNTFFPSSIEDIVNSFDFTCCACGETPDKMYAHPLFFQDLLGRRLRLIQDPYCLSLVCPEYLVTSRTSLNRYTKYVQTGFSPGNDADMKRLARQIQASCGNVEDYF